MKAVFTANNAQNQRTPKSAWKSFLLWLWQQKICGAEYLSKTK